MREKKLLESISKINEKYIEEAEPCRKKTSHRVSRRTIRLGAIAAVLVIAILCAVFIRPGGKIPTPGGILFTPVSAAYEPNFTAEYNGAELSGDYLSAIRAFAAEAGSSLLDGNATTAYSPVALYTALSMVSELADDSNRSALLKVLGSMSTEQLRQYSGDLWRYLCLNPDTAAPGKITLANSMWLNQDYNFNGETLQNLADYYYVSSYTGDMLNSIPAMVSEWVKKQTNNLLDCKIEPDIYTMAVLLSAIYFYDDWAQAFSEYDTTSGAFHSGEQEIACDYMHRTQEGWKYYRDNGVTASVQYFKNGGKMLFILPDMNSDPSAVLSNRSLLSSLFNWEALDKRTAEVSWAIPRFTMSNTLDLEKALTSLGLGELFNDEGNPLPLLTADDTPAYIGHVEQGTAISINETGCEAASYVKIELKDPTSAPVPPERVYISLTRPFVFAILSENDVPLFLGVINNPNG